MKLEPIHEHGYWLDQSQNGHFFDKSLAKQLAWMFKGQSVVDLGCGVGDYVHFLRDRNVDCIGYDGNPTTQFLANDRTFCQVLDLAERVSFEKQFDWVLSLEVGEHIPETYEQEFMDNIGRHCARGAVISWAVPGQSGRGHYNCRTNDYIIGQMIDRDLEIDEASGLMLRNHSILQWFKNTLMVFKCSTIPMM